MGEKYLDWEKRERGYGEKNCGDVIEILGKGTKFTKKEVSERKIRRKKVSLEKGYVMLKREDTRLRTKYIFSLFWEENKMLMVVNFEKQNKIL